MVPLAWSETYRSLETTIGKSFVSARTGDQNIREIRSGARIGGMMSTTIDFTIAPMDSLLTAFSASHAKTYS